jgi:hypothetical protein
VTSLGDRWPALPYAGDLPLSLVCRSSHVERVQAGAAVSAGPLTRTAVLLRLPAPDVLPRWTGVSDSAYAWEADAIAFLRDRLPDSEAYRGWSNFEFVGQDGSINEVDALILTPTKLASTRSPPNVCSGWR